MWNTVTRKCGGRRATKLLANLEARLLQVPLHSLVDGVVEGRHLGCDEGEAPGFRHPLVILHRETSGSDRGIPPYPRDGEGEGEGTPPGSGDTDASPLKRTPIRAWGHRHHLELLPGNLLEEVDVALG